jgi:hypothetical protein
MSEGWGMLAPSPTAHYFVGAWSLCRRVAPAPTTLDPGPAERTCPACRRMVAIRERIGPVEPVDLDADPEGPKASPF